MLILIRKCILCIILSGIFLFLVFLLPVISYNESELNYLKNNYSNLTDEESLNILQPDLSKKAFIVSEYHGVGINSEYKLAFIKYLNKHASVRYVLLELSVSSGFLLNEYLKTGNKELLDLVFSFYEFTSFYSKEEYQFYIDLYQYNKDLKESEKITLIGIDIEHSHESSKAFLDYYENKVNEKLITLINDNIKAKEAFYSTMNFELREKRLYDNYLILRDIYQIDKFYGQFGAMHCFKDMKSDNYRSLSYYLNTEKTSNVSLSVIVIMTYYRDCGIMEIALNGEEKHYLKRRFSNFNNANLSYFREQMILFRLTGDNSLYSEQMIWYEINETISGKVTTDYYDYILLINVSNSGTPLKASK